MALKTSGLGLGLGLDTVGLVNITGSRTRNGDERRSFALSAVGEPTCHWGLCLLSVLPCTQTDRRTLVAFEMWIWRRMEVQLA